MQISIIIPTYDGLTLLQKHLPSLLAAEGMADTELLIADDGSRDGTAEWLAKHVPQARVIRSEVNVGFSRACNAAIREAQGDALLLLNNDVSVTPEFLSPLLRALESHDDIFAVNASILLSGKEGQDEGEKTCGFHNGIFYVGCPQRSSARRVPTLYATACAALYRRDRVQSLGGFDEIFSPFYWEDVDLSYRALRRGWQVLYEPQSIVYHEHETTTSRVDPSYKSMIRERNQFLFVWKNVTDASLTAKSLLLGPFVGLYQARKRGGRGLWEGYWAALRLWPQVRLRRAVERRETVVRDRDILNRFQPISKQKGTGQ